MGTFATGVTVIATEADAEIHGMTANAFSSVSLDPPLVLVCLNRGTKMEGLLTEGASFSVNFLSSEQEALSRHFAGGYGNERDPNFAFTDFAGAPRLEGSLGTVSCHVENVVDGGDHVIVIGQVAGIDLDESERDPLLFWKGKYFCLDKSASNI